MYPLTTIYKEKPLDTNDISTGEQVIVVNIFRWKMCGYFVEMEIREYHRRYTHISFHMECECGKSTRKPKQSG